MYNVCIIGSDCRHSHGDVLLELVSIETFDTIEVYLLCLKNTSIVDCTCPPLPAINGSGDTLVCHHVLLRFCYTQPELLKGTLLSRNDTQMTLNSNSKHIFARNVLLTE